MNQNQYVVIYDGDCVMCNWSARQINRFDKKKKFKLISNTAGELQAYKGLSKESILLLENEKIYSYSTAVLLIAKNLPFPINLCYSFIIVPVRLRDSVYKFIAKNRYHWFGPESCSVHS